MNQRQQDRIARWMKNHPGVCPCASPFEDPGPTHIDACPFSDPDYVGDMPSPQEMRASLLSGAFALIGRRK